MSMSNKPFPDLLQKIERIIAKPLSRETRIFGLIIFIGLSSYYFITWRSVRVNLTDFPPMYAGARLLQANANVYDIESQCREQANIRPDLCMPFNHPPLLLPLISLISTADYAASYRRWSLILSVALLLCLVPSYLLSKNADASIQMLLFFPIFISITQGQDTVFLLLAILCWALLLQMKKDFWSGLVLALGLVKPHLVLLLAIPLLFSRFKAFLGFCLGGLAAVLFSWSLVGTQGLLGLIQITRLSATGTTFGVHHADMYSAVGIFARAGLSPYWVWPVFVLTLIGLSALWRRYPFSTHTLSLSIVGMTFGAPHLLLHDLAPLVIPLYLTHTYAPLLATFTILVFLGFGFPHIGVYLVMVTLATFLFWQINRVTIK